MPIVMIAEPYRPGNMGSFGKANYMYIAQSNFPLEYTDEEKLHSADSDRVWSWDHEHSSAVNKKHLPERMGLEEYLRTSSHEHVLAWLVELLKVEPGVTWTGWRILGSVNRSNGYPVYNYAVFARDPNGDTEVYSGGRAPNVRPGGWRGPSSVDRMWGRTFGMHYSRDGATIYSDEGSCYDDDEPR
jgi:hypothetical protein